MNAKLKPLKFKVGTPTKVGWYWRRMDSSFSKGKEVSIVHIRDYAGRLALGNSTLDGWDHMAQAEWAGPLQEPSN